MTNAKLDFDDFDGPITRDMIAYAVRDVETTWECFAALAERFARFGISSTPINRIFSEAGVGKAYLRDMGIAPWTKTQPDFPRQMIANIMSAYFGGRSEVRIRRELRQVMLCDFLSMYPTVCTLMGLWRFVIADGMTWQDATDDVRSLLNSITLADLQSPDIWRRLATIVRVKPDADIFPVRASYDGEQATIGSNYLTADKPLWFTLADCIGSKLLTGKTPEILEAVSFTPGPTQTDLKPILISGNSDYHVDPVKDDFYARVIQLRQETKRRLKSATGDAEQVALDTEQFALKIAANATSYGIFMEVHAQDRDKAFPVTVHNAVDQPFNFRSTRDEQSGPYFHPLLGTLITGAARLMLAITETLIAENGLEWAFCDTDSMAIAKPQALAIGDFYERVRLIAEWFTSLNPYGTSESILKIEDVNNGVDGNEAAPLHCWAVSAKRYALFNLDQSNRPILRKASAHGLGHFDCTL